MSKGIPKQVRHDKNVILNLGLMKIRLVSESHFYFAIRLAFEI